MFKSDKPLFEIEGVPIKKSFFKKCRSYLAVYNDYIEIEYDGDHDTIDLDDIFDIYVQEPLVDDVECRTVLVEYYEDGERCLQKLEDSVFYGVAAKMEEVLGKNWKHFAENHAYPDTVKWFVACTLVVQVSSGLNPDILGGEYKNPEVAESQREELRGSWGFRKREDLLEMLPKLYEGRAVNQYFENLEVLEMHDEETKDLLITIKNTCGDKGVWAWDLQRLILISCLGYVSDYISYEEALDWCLKAGKKLQGIYDSWDDFMQSYLLGYCFWSGNDLHDEESEAYQRAQIYKFYKNKKGSPFSVLWDHSLTREW